MISLYINYLLLAAGAKAGGYGILFSLIALIIYDCAIAIPIWSKIISSIAGSSKKNDAGTITTTKDSQAFRQLSDGHDSSNTSALRHLAKTSIIIDNDDIDPTDCWKAIHASAIRVSKALEKIALLVDNPPTFSDVQSAINKYHVTEYEKKLRAMPISLLNRKRLGIRVSALEHAGYHTIYQIRNISAQQLLSIPGIGRTNAILIQESLNTLCAEAKESINLNPYNNQTPEMKAAILECYKYSHLSRLWTCSSKELSGIRSSLQKLDQIIRKAHSEMNPKS